MSDKVVELRTVPQADHIPTGLKNIVEDLEKGRWGLVTSCIVVIGHTYEKDMRTKDSTEIGERWTTFGLGPRHDPFTVKGLLITAAADLVGTMVPDEPEENAAEKGEEEPPA